MLLFWGSYALWWINHNYFGLCAPLTYVGQNLLQKYMPIIIYITVLDTLELTWPCPEEAFGAAAAVETASVVAVVAAAAASLAALACSLANSAEAISARVSKATGT